MLISKLSPKGITHTMDISVTKTQLIRWENGEHIQDVMPDLTDYEREFLMTGITEEEWNETFSEIED